MYSPTEMADICVDAGVAKAKQTVGKAFLLAVFAGVFIALGSLGSVAASVSLHGVADGVVRALVFPAGLTFVLVSGAELFTGNCLMIMAVLQGKVSVWRMLSRWGIVYLGNFLGSLLAAVWTLASGLLSFGGGWLGRAFVMMAVTKTSASWGAEFMRGVGCNFLVCIAVWMSYSTKHTSGKIAALWPPVFLFVLCALEHSVANMSAIPTGIMASRFLGIADAGSAPSVSAFLCRNLIPVTLGNIAGGALVALGYWAGYLKGKR